MRTAPRGPRHSPGAERRQLARRAPAAVAYTDSDPDVVVLGAGQGGLTVAANLRLMGVDALILEKSERVGDGWRKRYHSLVLHDPVWADDLPYMPYPASWPVYCPKDKIADWFESYASAMELNVWTSAEMTDSSYDEATGRWTLTVSTPEGERVIHPRDVVLATGAAGEPNVPDVPGRDTFRGTSYHSSRHASASELGRQEGRRRRCLQQRPRHRPGPLPGRRRRHPRAAVVDAHHQPDPRHPGDLRQQLRRGRAAARSTPTCSPAARRGRWCSSSPRTASSRPPPRMPTCSPRSKPSGFKLNDGPDGTGLMGYALAYGGGYYIDVGASTLIAEGKIKLAQGSGLAEFTPDGIRLADGRTLEADLVVLATGYRNMRETARRLFGDDVADRLPLVLGVGEDGELGGLYRRTGHPAFWYMGGPLAWVRIYSKHLALQITAKHAGISPT